MTRLTLADLPGDDRADLLELAAALDDAAGPVPAAALPPDPRVRGLLDRLLAARGRTLVEVTGPDADADVEATTAVVDDVADTLAAAGVEVLDADERAVVALILLHTVVLPSAAGRPPARWDRADRVPAATLKANRHLPDTAIRDATRRLRYRGLVDYAPTGVKLTAAILRLTPRARRRVEADLIALCSRDNPVVAAVVANLTADDPRPARAAKDLP